ncbi:uncharacterized protein ACOB8E_002012 [Sarcophilus harrisii]
MFAVSLKLTQMVNILLQHNVDHTIKDKMGRTAENYASISNYPLFIYLKQIEQYTHFQLQVSNFEKASDTRFVLGTSSMDKKVISEENSSEASIERLPEKPGADDSWQNMDDKINFEKEEDSADSEEEEKKKDVLVNNFTVLEEEDDKEAPWDSEEHLKDSDVEKKKNVILPDYYTSLQKTSENPNIPNQLQAPGTSDKSAAIKRLDKKEESDSPWDSEEYISDPDVEKKHIVILPDYITRTEKTSENPNIPNQLQAPDTSHKGAVRKGKDKEEDSDSPWDSEEYISDPDVEKKHIIILPDYSTRTQKTSENPNIPNQLQAPDTSDKGAVRKGKDKEEDSDSPWDSEEYISDPDVEKKHIIILPDYSTRTQNTSENPNIPNQLQAPDTSDKGAVRKGKDKEEDSDSPWDSEEYISDPDVEKKHIIILPDYSTRTQNTSENPNIPNQLQAPDTSDKGAVRKGKDKEEDSDSPWDSEEYISDPDVEKKHIIILPDYSTRTQNTSENPNIPNQLQAPDTSDKGAVRKGKDKEEDSDSPWDSEEYISDPDVEKKHIIILPDYSTRTQNTSENPNIPNQLQAPDTSDKGAVRKGKDKEEDSDSPWDSEEYISDPDVEKKHIIILPDYSTRTQNTSENPNIPNQLQAPDTSDKGAVRKGKDKEEDSDSPWDSEEYISDPDVEKKHIIILPDYSTRTQNTSENPNIPNQLQAPDTSDKGAVRKGKDKEEDSDSPWDSEEYISDPDVEKKHIIILPDYSTKTQNTSENPNIPNQLQAPDTSDKGALRVFQSSSGVQKFSILPIITQSKHQQWKPNPELPKFKLAFNAL